MSDAPPSTGENQPPEDKRPAMIAPLFRKGVSGNPGGRPKSEKAFVRRAREMTLADLESIAAANQKLDLMIQVSEKAEDLIALVGRRVENFNVIAQRGFGKVPEKVVIEDDTRGGKDTAEFLALMIPELRRRRDEAQAAQAQKVIEVEGKRDP